MKRNSCQKSIISCQIAAFFMLAMVSGCAKKEIKNIGSKGKNIICFGDSITFGYGAEKGEDYPSALAELADKPVINAGIDGDTTEDALKRVKADVLDKDPFFVIIEFEGNDLLKEIPKEKSFSNIRKMVDMAQAEGAMVAIADISAGLFLKEYRQGYYEIAREKGVLFIPSILSGIITNPSMKSDFLHPNANGYKLVAQRIYRAIKPYLDRSKSLVNPVK
jgi:acyl-CoA thioesterase I